MRKKLFCALYTILAAFASSLNGQSTSRKWCGKIRSYFGRNQNQLIPQNVTKLHSVENLPVENQLEDFNKNEKLIQNHNSNVLPSADFDELQINEETIGALVAKLYVIQNYQKVTEKNNFDSSFDLIGSKSEKLKKDRIDIIRAAISTMSMYSKLEIQSRQTLEFFVENYSLTSAWKFKFSHHMNLIVRKDFEKFCKKFVYCISFHDGSLVQKNYLLDCGHWKCIFCIKSCLNDYEFSNMHYIKCNLCKFEFPFRTQNYLDAYSVNSIGEKDANKPIELHFYINYIIYNTYDTFKYKRCPKLSCDYVVKIKYITKDTRDFYSEVQCANFHTFCAFCSASFKHTPFKCRELRKLKSNDFLLWDEQFLVHSLDKQTQPECEKCERPMRKVDNSKIVGENLKSLIKDCSLYVCPACKHIFAADNTASKSVFYKALLLSQSIQKSKEDLLLTAGLMLRNASLFFLCSVMIVKEKYEVFFLKGKTQTIKKNVNGYFNLFKKSLGWYVFLVEELISKKNAKAVSLLTDASKKLQAIVHLHTKIFEQRQFQDGSITMFFDSKKFHKLTHFSLPGTTTGPEALELLASCFVEPQSYTSFDRISFESLQSGEEPLQKVADKIKTAFYESEYLKQLAQQHLKYDLTAADFNRIAIEFQLDSKKAFHSLRNDDFIKVMKKCGIILATTCAECKSHFEPQPYGWADCGHYTHCEMCFKQKIEIQISEKNWCEQTNLIKCFVENCKSFLYVGVIRSVIGENGPLWKTYNQNLLLNLTMNLGLETDV